MIEVLGCGVQGHSDDCLCDVVIPSGPSDVNVSLGGNWVLSMVASYFGLSWPWTADKLGFLLERSSVFIEEHAVRFPRVAVGIDVERGNNEPFPSYTARVKQGLMEVAKGLGAGCLPSQVRDVAGLSHEQFVSVLTNNRTDPALITPDMYDGFITALRAGAPFKPCCRQHGLPENSRSGIGAWLRETFITQFDNQ